MRKLLEIRNAFDDRTCDLVREDDDSLCYHMKYRDKRGKTRDVVITVSDLFYPAWCYMTEKEREHTLHRLCQGRRIK